MMLGLLDFVIALVLLQRKSPNPKIHYICCPDLKMDLHTWK